MTELRKMWLSDFTTGDMASISAKNGLAIELQDRVTGLAAKITQNADDSTSLEDLYGLVVNSILFGRISNTETKPVRIDASTHSLQTIDYAHHEIHTGGHFFYTDFDNDVDTASPKYYRLTTPDTTKWIHMNLTLYSEGAGTWQLFENPTVNAAGTGATVFNNNRNSATVAGLVIATDPTSTADGTLLKSWRTGSGTAVPTRVGSASGRDEEIILKQNEDYFIKFTPDADNSKTKLELEWYEHTDKN
jgi:hypothetical protein